MEETIEAYNPTMLTGLGLFLTLYIPVVFTIAMIGDGLLSFAMTTIMLAPLVGVFTTPAGFLVLIATALLARKHPEKRIEWQSAISGSCVAVALGAVAWFMQFSFAN